jgi:predicted alpha/beta-fold hydrolase
MNDTLPPPAPGSIAPAGIAPDALPWLAAFEPRRFLRNGHAQTLVGNFLRRQSLLPEPEARVVEVEPAAPGRPASHVLCHCHWQPLPVRSARLTVLLLHGLEGSSRSRYILGNASRLWAAGCNVVRMNMRNCGATEHLTPTLYHSGLSGDVGAVLDALTAEHGLAAWALVGYSMGGNLVLKYAGERGPCPPPALKAVVGVSPVIDLAPSADALHAPANRVYEWKFLRGLGRRYERKAALFPHIYRAGQSRGVRSIRDFDERVMAPYSGFAGAEDYYHRVSSARVVHRIAVPTLILHALDDPFIRIDEETRTRLLANPHITLVETENGGHCAFLDAPAPGHDGHWAERTLAAFLLHTARP